MMRGRVVISRGGQRAMASLIVSPQHLHRAHPCPACAHATLRHPRRTFATASPTPTHNISTPPPSLAASSSSSSRPSPPPAAPSVSTNTAAAAAAAAPTPASSSSPPRPLTIRTGVLLSRPPILTRALTAFESSFYLYQKRLNERLALPFTRYFYVKKDTPADHEWKRKARARNGAAARELGGYQAYGAMGWNDEVLEGERGGGGVAAAGAGAGVAAAGDAGEGVRAAGEQGAPQASTEADAGETPYLDSEEWIREALVRDAESTGLEGGGSNSSSGGEGEGDEAAKRMVERPRSRLDTEEASADRKRLDRRMDETLYLLVRGGKQDGRWVLPSGELVGNEALHQAAERVLVQSAGINMNTWVVGRVPVGFHSDRAEAVSARAAGDANGDDVLESASETTKTMNKKKPLWGPETATTFFLKARILAGQADLAGNAFGLEDFCWVTKDEMRELVGSVYWRSMRGMLADR